MRLFESFFPPGVSHRGERATVASIALLLLSCVLLALSGCALEPSCGGTVRARFNPAEGFWAAPFPSEHLRTPTGGIDLSSFPKPNSDPFGAVIDQFESLGTGFGTTSAVYLPFDGLLDVSTLPKQVFRRDGASVVLVDVDPLSPERDSAVPIWISFRGTEQTSSPANLLALLPRPGQVLRPNNFYAAMVLDEVKACDGSELVVPPTLASLLRGESVGLPELEAGFSLLSEHLARVGTSSDRVRAATVYRTGDPLLGSIQLRDAALALPQPQASNLRSLRDEASYCAVEGAVSIPLYQQGQRPFARTGGAIEFGPDDIPRQAGEETVRFVVTVPKGVMPAGGWPLLFYSAGQGGAYTQVLDRGTFEEQDMLIQGRGPALYLAESGIAAIGIEAPLVGPRNPEPDPLEIAFFNPVNAVALRDNIRQAAVDFHVLVRMASQLSVPDSLCASATAGPAGHVYDSDRFYFHGHSTGATIGGLVLGLDGEISAGVLSGYGGSYLYNLAIKEKPEALVSLLPLLLGLQLGDSPDIFDPILNILQAFWEPAEPMNWSRSWTEEPVPGGKSKDILIVAGVVDGFFPPPAINAGALAARAQLVAPAVEPTLQETLLEIGFGTPLAPAQGNAAGGLRSAYTVQYEQAPGDQDGHYVLFQQEAPKHQFRCFFESHSRIGRAVVVSAVNDALSPCSP